MSPEPTTRAPFPPGAHGYQPTDEEVQNLIARAREHPLGLDFLTYGALDAVSATFGIHAFVVDAAREYLALARPRSDC